MAGEIPAGGRSDVWTYVLIPITDKSNINYFEH